MSKREAQAIELVRAEWEKSAGPDELSTVAINGLLVVLYAQYGSRIRISRVRGVLDKLAKTALSLDEALDGAERRLKELRPRRVSVTHQAPIFSIPSDE